MATLPGFVGHIKIKSQHHLIGQQLLNDVSHWVNESGWKEALCISLETDLNESFVELLPGEFQSNGPKKIGLTNQARISDFEADLYKWLWEVEELT